MEQIEQENEELEEDLEDPDPQVPPGLHTHTQVESLLGVELTVLVFPPQAEDLLDQDSEESEAFPTGK